MNTVLLVGGAGSLGRGFVEYLVKDPTTSVVNVVDSNEWACAELAHLYPDVTVRMCDLSDYLPHERYIVYLAAHKHVDLCEKNISACVDNNLTKLVDFYDKVPKDSQVLYISTDKAVEPISVYGATKMIAERLTWQRGWQVARLGNLLASSGSVIPTWEYQIANSKPVTITDERMIRYFAEIKDVVPYLWERFVEKDGLIIPPMGEIRVMDLLNHVLKKHGYMMPEAYEAGVQITGLRSGEKLREKMRWDNE